MAIAKDILGSVFSNGSAVLLARVVDSQGLPVTQASVASVEYSIFALEVDDPLTLTAVVGHEAVTLDIADVIFDTLQNDAAWTLDEVGYNFRHEVDVTTNEAFPQVGRVYQIRYEMLPLSGQKIVFRFQVRCI